MEPDDKNRKCMSTQPPSGDASLPADSNHGKSSSLHSISNHATHAARPSPYQSSMSSACTPSRGAAASTTPRPAQAHRPAPPSDQEHDGILNWARAAAWPRTTDHRPRSAPMDRLAPSSAREYQRSWDGARADHLAPSVTGTRPRSAQTHRPAPPTRVNNAARAGVSPRAIGRRAATETRGDTLKWERRQIFSLPVTEAIYGESATFRAAPRLTKKKPSRPPPKQPLSQEDWLDQVWNEQASMLFFQHLLDEEQEVEDEIHAIKAAQRHLVLQELKERYKKQSTPADRRKPMFAHSFVPRSAGHPMPSAYRRAPIRSRKTTSGLPWSYVGPQILQTETSLLQAGWSRKDVDDFLHEQYAC